METGWNDAVADDLQALARIAALQVPAVPVPTLQAEAEAGEGAQGSVVLAQRAGLCQLTMEAYERWAATYPGAADALERSMEGVTAAVGVREVEELIRRAQMASGTEDWVDEETLPLLYGQEKAPPWRPPVVQAEQYLAWSLPSLKAALVGFLRTWPAHAPLLRA